MTLTLAGRRADLRRAILEDRPEIEIVAEGARADMLEALAREEYRGGGESDDRGAPAIGDRLGAKGLARHRVEHADQIGRHRERRAVAPGHNPFVLKGDFEP